MLSSASAEEDEDVVHQCSEGRESCYDVGVSSAMERVGRHFGGGVIGDTCFSKPVHCTLAGVHLYREGDQGEEGEHRIEDDTEQHEYLSGTGAKQEESGEDDPGDPFAGERHYRNEG